MLFKILKKQIEKYGLTEELHQKIDELYALGRLTDEEYQILVSVNAE